MLGTEIYVSFLFTAVIAFMLATDRTGLVIPTLLASLIHEAGHLFAMWIADAQPKRIRLIPASIQIVRGLSPKREGEAAIAIAGPAANFAVFLSLFLNYLLFKKQSVLEFSLLQLILCVFNLLPVSGLDGGTLLCLLLSKKYDVQKAEGIVRIVTALFAAAVFVTGVWMWVSGQFNLSVFIIAIYLAIGCIIRG